MQLTLPVQVIILMQDFYMPGWTVNPIDTCLKWGNITGGLSTTRAGWHNAKDNTADVMETISSKYIH